MNSPSFWFLSRQGRFAGMRVEGDKIHGARGAMPAAVSRDLTGFENPSGLVAGLVEILAMNEPGRRLVVALQYISG